MADLNVTVTDSESFVLAEAIVEVGRQGQGTYKVQQTNNLGKTHFTLDYGNYWVTAWKAGYRISAPISFMLDEANPLWDETIILTEAYPPIVKSCRDCDLNNDGIVNDEDFRIMAMNPGQYSMKFIRDCLKYQNKPCGPSPPPSPSVSVWNLLLNPDIQAAGLLLGLGVAVKVARSPEAQLRVESFIKTLGQHVNVKDLLELTAFGGLLYTYYVWEEKMAIAFPEAAVDYLLLKSQTEAGVGAVLGHLLIRGFWEKLEAWWEAVNKNPPEWYKYWLENIYRGRG